jgi:uncharacterized membrane protein YgaE (UPF0421/DUF939 family)
VGSCKHPCGFSRIPIFQALLRQSYHTLFPMSKLASDFFYERRGSLLMDKNEKQWYFSCALQRQNRYLNMKEVLFNKLQRLKEETKYLGDNKPKFLRTLKSSIEAKKIVERSVYLCAEIALGRQSAPDAPPCGRR